MKKIILFVCLLLVSGVAISNPVSGLELLTIPFILLFTVIALIPFIFLYIARKKIVNGTITKTKLILLLLPAIWFCFSIVFGIKSAEDEYFKLTGKSFESYDIFTIALLVYSLILVILSWLVFKKYRQSKKKL